MKKFVQPGWLRAGVVPVAAVALAVGAVVARNAVGSDHVDTAEVELSPTLDLTDVFVFPGTGDDRVAIVVDVASPINALGRSVTGFNPNALYQINIDNNGDAVADLAFQFLFDQMTDGTQQVNVLGPAAPTDLDAGPGVVSTLIESPVSVGNPFNQTFTTENGIQVFAGPRRDPFYFDFAQFVQILPDRRPATFLNNVDDDAFMPNAFCGDAPPFVTTCEPTNTFEGFNTLSIVIEVPESMLGAGTGADDSIGVWATIGI